MFDFLFGEKKKKRKKLSEWEKQVILERQNYRCAMCGKQLKPGVIHFDHKKPLALGGKDDISNIQALCPECHHIKTKRDRYKIAKAKKESSIGISIDLGLNFNPLDPLGTSSKKMRSSSRRKSGGQRRSSRRSKRKKNNDFWLW